jgi:putative ABC transport system ATP-binding protein
MNENILQAIDIHKSFFVGSQEIQVLKGVSFEVKTGDFAIILGPSGSGKSTLLHILLGLELPTSGKVICLNTDLYDYKSDDDRSAFRKKHVGMVYQQPNWIKSLNVLENVSFPLALLGVGKLESLKRARESLVNLGMEDWINYVPTELSGGQQQKVALARALVTNPELIIADEPTGNLDFESGQALIQLLVKMNNLGKTVLMVTHDLEYVKYGKTAIRIKDGVVQDITTGESKASIEQAAPKKRGVVEENA